MSGSVKRIVGHPIRVSAVLVLGLVALSFVALGQAAPSTFLELDNNIWADNTGTPPPYDWANSGPNLTAPTTPGGEWTLDGVNGIFDGGIYNGQPTPPTPPEYIPAPGVVDADFIVDPLAQDVTSCGSGDPTVYTGAGGETNGELFSTMTWSTGSVPPKDEISNVYALAHNVGSVDEVFFGAERIINDGDSHIDFEFLQSAVTLTGTCSGGFEGDRSQGDLLISVDFTKGGLQGNPLVYEWHCLAEGSTQPATGTVCNPPAHGKSVPHYQQLTSGPAVSAVTFGVNSSGPVDCGGWVCRDKGAGSSTTVDTNEFMEGGINLAELGFEGCISTFIPHTRSSQSFTATLKDFAIVPFNTCKGSLIIKKEDAGGNLLPGAGFTFDVDPFTGTGGPVNIDDGGAADQADGNDGLICIDGVIPGTYDITEYKVPAGYAGDPDTETVTVEAGTSNSMCADRLEGTVTPDVTFTNLLGSILIHKVDGAGNDLAGAGFTFDPDPFTGGDPIEILDGGSDDQADDDDGWLCIDNVLLDTYDITETTVPAGYAGDTDTETITVDSASTCADRLAAETPEPDAEFTNLLGSILIHKVDGAGNDLAGAGFTFDPDPFTGGTAVEILDGATEDQADDDDGWLCIDNVLLDTYDITESTIPDGYVGDTDTETVTVSSASTCADRLADTATADATFTNLLGSILIHKVDGAGNDLAGAGFTFDPDPFTGGTAVEILDGATEDQADDDDGWLCIDNVLLDTYDITETTVPSGYAGDTGTKTVTVSSASTCADRLAAATVTPDAIFTNLLGSIIVKKVDGAGSLLPGAGYTFDVNPFTGGVAIEIKDGDAVDQADADNGLLCIDNVRLGTYHLTETTVPSGFFGDTSTKTVTVSSASTCATRLADTPTADATFTNKKGSLMINKVAKNKNAVGGIAPLGGATFTITPNPLTGMDSLDISDDGTNDVFDTTEGVICIDDVWNLGAGNSYSIVEKTAPANYQKDSSTKTKEVTSPSTCEERTVSGAADATFTNVPLSQIEVIFTSSAGSGVTEATIICADSSGIPLSFTSGSDPDLDKIFTGLPPGTYSCTIVIDP
jgi:hypothetical protein